MSFSAADLTKPKVIEIISFEDTLAEIKADLLAIYPAASTVLDNEAEPINYLLQVCAYREMVQQQKANDRVLAISLAYSEKADLDFVGEDRYQIKRLTLVPATADSPAVMEEDEDYRARIYRSLDAKSTAGPEGAYESLAFNAHADVASAKASSPADGTVLVSVLSRSDSGQPSAEVLQAVYAAVSDDKVRPLTDRVLAQAATVTTVEITATLHPEPSLEENGAAAVLAEAQKKAATLIARRQIGRNLELSEIYAALHVPGISYVNLISPANAVTASNTSAVLVTAVNLTLESV